MLNQNSVLMHLEQEIYNQSYGPYRDCEISIENI
jgi:hypothetical protein